MIDRHERKHSVHTVQTMSLHIPASDMVLAVWRRRYWLAIFTGAGVLLSIAIALLITPEYTSTAELMPVNPTSLSSSSSLDLLDGVQGVLRQSSFLSEITPGATAIGILESRTELDSIINKLNLRESFHLKTMADTRKRLLGKSTFTEDKNSGIVTIRILDEDRSRAQQISQAFIDVLNELIVNVNSSSAHRERVFLEERLRSVKGDLDATAAKLSQFSSHSGALNPETQGQALIVSVTQLQSLLIAARSDLQELKTKYSSENVRVRAAQARIDELNRQINSVTAGETLNKKGAAMAGDSYPSLRQLPVLDVTYLDLARQLATQQAVYETLTKQYEMAKVQESKELPIVKVLDQPDLAESKTSPRRTIIVIFGTFLFFLAGIVWISISKLWTDMSESDPIKATLSKIRQGILSNETVLS